MLIFIWIPLSDFVLLVSMCVRVRGWLSEQINEYCGEYKYEFVFPHSSILYFYLDLNISVIFWCVSNNNKTFFFFKFCTESSPRRSSGWWDVHSSSKCQLHCEKLTIGQFCSNPTSIDCRVFESQVECVGALIVCHCLCVRVPPPNTRSWLWWSTNRIEFYCHNFINSVVVLGLQHFDWPIFLQQKKKSKQNTFSRWMIMWRQYAWALLCC